jgi:thymidylate synthase
MPVTTMYVRPQERVLFDPVRDANPFFHLFESLWMLAGRDDATFLDQFVSDFSARFAEDGGIQHGAYGRRWRDWFLAGEEFDHIFEDMNPDNTIDQLDEVVRLLRENRFDRQAVIQMWDASRDLGVPDLKDRPCNQNIMLRADRGALDITVTCRSNDIVFGCYGANSVHFSMLQEYLAARIGLPMGVYYQVSNNWHLYDWAMKHVDLASARANSDVYTRKVGDYPGTFNLVDNAEAFDDELHDFLHSPLEESDWINEFFPRVAQPLWEANLRRKDKDWNGALICAANCAAPDWRHAAMEWLQRRAK